jgi:hypothetical protein
MAHAPGPQGFPIENQFIIHFNSQQFCSKALDL